MITPIAIGAMTIAVCRTDFEIWDHVLARCWRVAPGMKLETMSNALDRADAATMLARVCDHEQEIKQNSNVFVAGAIGPFLSRVSKL